MISVSYFTYLTQRITLVCYDDTMFHLKCTEWALEESWNIIP